MNDLASRVVNALLAGIITGLVVALVLFVISALLPGVTIDASFWGTVVGVLAALVSFLQNRSVI